MDVELVDSVESLRKVLPEWQRFRARSPRGGNLFNDPDYILLQVESNPDCRPYILIVRNSGEICCVAPFFLNDTRFQLKLSVFTLWRPRATFLRIFGDDFIVSADQDANACFQAVFRFLRLQRRQFSLIYFDKVDIASPLWRFCTSRTERRAFHAYLASASVEMVHRIRLPENHDAFMAQISHETRRKLRRLTKKLCTEKSTRLVKFTTPAEVPSFLQSLDEVYRDSWQAKSFGYHSKNNDSERRMLTKIAELGWLRSYLLMSESKPIAFELSYQHEGILHRLDCGFSQEWAEFGPGTVLLHLCIEDVIQNDSPELFDFGFGDASYKRSLSNEHYEAGSLYLTAKLRWRFLMVFQRILYVFESLVRSAATRFKIDRYLRKLVKRQR